MRICTTCNSSKPEADFYWMASRTAYDYMCKACRSEYGRQWRARNNDKVVARRARAAAAMTDEQRSKKRKKEKQWKEAHPEYWTEYIEANRLSIVDKRLRKLYGIGLEEYTTILDQQGGVCAICKALAPKDGERRFSVDHDHSCCAGKTSCGQCVRGILCHRCNTGVGYFRDSPDHLKSAILYLTK